MTWPSYFLIRNTEFKNLIQFKITNAYVLGRIESIGWMILTIWVIWVTFFGGSSGCHLQTKLFGLFSNRSHACSLESDTAWILISECTSIPWVWWMHALNHWCKTSLLRIATSSCFEACAWCPEISFARILTCACIGLILYPAKMKKYMALLYIWFFYIILHYF